MVNQENFEEQALPVVGVEGGQVNNASILKVSDVRAESYDILVVSTSHTTAWKEGQLEGLYSEVGGEKDEA